MVTSFFEIIYLEFHLINYNVYRNNVDNFTVTSFNQLLLFKYQSTVFSKPSSNFTDGLKPSSFSILEASIAYLKS